MNRWIFYGIAGVLVFVLWKIVSLKLKHGASIENVSWRMFYAALIVESVLALRAVETVITSGADGKHKATSKHYAENNPSGMVEALDFRSRDVEDPVQARDEMQEKLGPAYQVLLERDHFHVEYDPA